MARLVWICPLWLCLVSPGFADFDPALRLASANAHPWGLAFDDLEAGRLFVADEQADRIFAYDLEDGRARHRARADLHTRELHPEFSQPRGLACVDGQLYALSSVACADGFRSRLWRFSPAHGGAQLLELDAAELDLRGCELLDLSAHGDELFLSYDSSSLASDWEQVRRGILALKVPGGLARLFAGELPANLEVRHLPASGRAIKNGRALTYGLAWQQLDGEAYLWSTSHHKYVCLAEAATGRGIFALRTPGQTWGLAATGGLLWSVERDADGARLRSLDPGSLAEAQPQGTFIRHLEMRQTSTPRGGLPTRVQHNFALPSSRPHQSYDQAGMTLEATPEAPSELLRFDPAGDAATRQSYLQFRFEGEEPGTSLESKVAFDVTTSRYRHYVFPHLCGDDAGEAASYLGDAAIFALTEADSYARFLAAAEDAQREEYGPAAVSDNPYWRMRGLLELIVENYAYGNVKDPQRGHYSYNPVPPKLRLLLDAESGNEKLSCSPSSFVMAGMARHLGIPSRWVGTTRQRQTWDADGNQLMTRGESAQDEAFHRWAEIWLGPHYGWQRFDATPAEQPHEHSQFSLMHKVAAGVGSRDLVLLVSDGDLEAFARQSDGNQRYNLVARYDDPAGWRSSQSLVWSNACFLDVTAPLGPLEGDPLELTWQLEGRWDLDPEARVSVYLVPQQAGEEGWRSQRQRYQLARDLPARAQRLRFDPSPYPAGHYRFLVVKVGDSETGGESCVVQWGVEEIVEAAP